MKRKGGIDLRAEGGRRPRRRGGRGWGLVQWGRGLQLGGEEGAGTDCNAVEGYGSRLCALAILFR